MIMKNKFVLIAGLIAALSLGFVACNNTAFNNRMAEGKTVSEIEKGGEKI